MFFSEAEINAALFAIFARFQVSGEPAFVDLTDQPTFPLITTST